MFYLDRQVSRKQKVDEIVNMMTYISAILRPCDLKFGMCEVYTLFYAWQPKGYVF